MKNPKIACLGGGNGMPKAVLAGLKEKEVELSVVCAMLDSGGSTGRLREDYDIRAPGDLRRALIALANTSPVVERLFNWRFKAGELSGHNFANLLITALELNCDHYEDAVEELKRILDVRHEVFPVTLDRSEVCARLENGRVVRGETKIDKPEHDPNLEIKDIFLEPRARGYEPALEAIESADLIVIGPGDLYSTLAQILLVEGVPRAVKKSKGRSLYLVNLMNKKGETNNFSVSDFSGQIEEWLGEELDFVLYNCNFPGKERLKEYRSSHPELMGMVRPAGPLSSDKFKGEDLMRDEGPLEHDPDKVADAIISLID